MRKKLIKMTLLGVTIASSVFATEFRSPWLSERGPIRYRFEKGDPDRYSLDIWSVAHRREAHKAFLKHGTDTKPLTALFFNKDVVPLVEIFPGSEMSTAGNYYNPYVDLLKINPKATYYEHGMNIGGRFEYPVWKDKGRIGIRANIPFRSIEIERENILDKTKDPSRLYVRTRRVDVGTQDADAATTPVYATAYNLACIDKLGGLAFDTTEKTVRVFSQDVMGDEVAAANKSIKTDMGLFAGVIYATGAPEDGKFPTEPDADHRWAFNAWDNTDYSLANWTAHRLATDGVAAPAMDAITTAKGIGFFEHAQAYDIDSTDQLKKMWLVLGYERGDLAKGARTVADGFEAARQRWQTDPYQWLLEKGNFEFETTRRTGLGDVDLDFFYEHTFSDEWMGELMLGVRLPTGGSDDYSSNPYQAHLGNGDHWEIKLGAMAAWEPIDWMNIKLDMYYSFALEATEHRCAAFTGAEIKNIGPRVDADVDWSYFVGRLDFNLFHPKTKDISTTIGYEFYYKTADSISYKSATALPWYASSTQTTLVKPLDHKVAERNTEAIGHKVRFESGFVISDWLEFFVGGSYTFAGQNLPRETDCHGGCNVKF